MAVRKLSQIATAGTPPAPTDQVVGVQGGVTDVLFSVSQILSGLILPGDVLTNSGTPAVAAHSMVRKLFSAYSGKLFQVRRASDNATLDIGTLSDGWADVPSLGAFIAGTAGFVTQVYDQTGNNNILPQATAGNQGAVTLMYTQLGRQIPVVTCASGKFYRNRNATTGIPVGASPITVLMVVTNQLTSLIGTYGDMENPVADSGNGHLFALARNANGIGTDWENGVFYGGGAAGTSTQPAQLSDFVFALSKTDAVANWVIKGGPASSPILHTIYSGGLPSGYTAHFEGGISVGEGGDGTSSPVEFVEGIIVAAVSSDAADQAIQNNLSASFGSAGALLQYPDRLQSNEPLELSTLITLGGVISVLDAQNNLLLDYNKTNLTNWTIHQTSGIEFSAGAGGPQFFFANDSDLTAIPLVGGPTTAAYALGAGHFYIKDFISGHTYLDFSPGGNAISLLQNAVLGFSTSTSLAGTAPDTGASRGGAGKINIGNGTAGDASGTINATGYQSAGTPGISATITTAKVTPVTGANGSMTFVNGILTAQTQAT